MLLPLCAILIIIAADCDGRKSRKGDDSIERHASEEGLVGGGNYSFYTLETPADREVVLTVLLHSLEGDADLYIAGKNKRPSFEVEEHSFQSATCGDDLIIVPSHFVREESPIVIGVYGHPRFHVSTYYVEVVWEPDLRNLCDKNSYEENAGPVTDDGADEEPVKAEGWDFFQTIGLQILQIILEVLVS